MKSFTLVLALLLVSVHVSDALFKNPFDQEFGPTAKFIDVSHHVRSTASNIQNIFKGLSLSNKVSSFHVSHGMRTLVSSSCQSAIDKIIPCAGALQGIEEFTATAVDNICKTGAACDIDISASFDSLFAACTADEVQTQFGMTAEQLATGISVTKSVCIKDNNAYCFPKFFESIELLDQATQDDNSPVNTTTLDSICSPCARKIALNFAASSSSDFSEAVQSLDLVCSKDGNKYCIEVFFQLEAALRDIEPDSESESNSLGFFNDQTSALFCDPCTSKVFRSISDMSKSKNHAESSPIRRALKQFDSSTGDGFDSTGDGFDSTGDDDDFDFPSSSSTASASSSSTGAGSSSSTAAGSGSSTAAGSGSSTAAGSGSSTAAGSGSTGHGGGGDDGGDGGDGGDDPFAMIMALIPAVCTVDPSSGKFCGISISQVFAQIESSKVGESCAKLQSQPPVCESSCSTSVYDVVSAGGCCLSNLVYLFADSDESNGLVQFAKQFNFATDTCVVKKHTLCVAEKFVQVSFTVTNLKYSWYVNNKAKVDDAVASDIARIAGVPRKSVKVLKAWESSVSSQGTGSGFSTQSIRLLADSASSGVKFDIEIIPTSTASAAALQTSVQQSLAAGAPLLSVVKSVPPEGKISPLASIGVDKNSITVGLNDAKWEGTDDFSSNPNTASSLTAGVFPSLIILVSLYVSLLL